MQTPRALISSRYRDRGSKFIGHLFPAAGREEFEGKLQSLRSEYPDATHHCYAWRIGPADPREFASDDGEPSGSAGPPILNLLRSAELINAGLVVVRYYGGTNLGVPGLIDAYGHTAALCLEEAELSAVRLFRRLRLCYPYGEQNLVDRLKHRYGMTELESKYHEAVTLELGCPPERFESLGDELRQAGHRGVEWEDLGTDYR